MSSPSEVPVMASVKGIVDIRDAWDAWNTTGMKINAKENEINTIAEQIGTDVTALRIMLRMKAEAVLSDNEKLVKEKFVELEELKELQNDCMAWLKSSEVYLLLFCL